MIEATLHTKSTAPEESKPLLVDSKQVFGMIPNLHAVMAESPALLDAYKIVHELFQKTSFDEDELTVVWQTINVEHECRYCVPAHTWISYDMGVSQEISDALRNNTPLPTPRLEALRVFTLKVVRQRGRLEEQDVERFFEAGYTQQNILEVILGVSQKVMSNYTNHLFSTPLDRPFARFNWQQAG